MTKIEPRGFWTVNGPYFTEGPNMRWRAEFTPFGKCFAAAGVTAWGRTEKDARRKALLRARLKKRVPR